jgi:hypothetical protein
MNWLLNSKLILSLADTLVPVVANIVFAVLFKAYKHGEGWANTHFSPAILELISQFVVALRHNLEEQVKVHPEIVGKDEDEALHAIADLFKKPA